MTLPAFAAERRRLLSTDISCPRGAQQQTGRTPLLLSIDGSGTDRRTDGRTLDRFIDVAPHIVRAVSIMYRCTQWVIWVFVAAEFDFAWRLTIRLKVLRYVNGYVKATSKPRLEVYAPKITRVLKILAMVFEGVWGSGAAVLCKCQQGRVRLNVCYCYEL